MGRKRNPRSHYLDPRDEYILSKDKITLTKLAKKWGTNLTSMQQRCTKEDWKKQRREHWTQVRCQVIEREQKRQIGEREKMIAQINDAHLRYGEVLLLAAKQLFKLFAQNPEESISPRDAARMLPQMVKAGVDIQRKAVGLADRKLEVEFAYSFVGSILNVIQKNVIDPDLYASIKRELEILLVSEGSGLEEMAISMSEELGSSMKDILDTEAGKQTPDIKKLLNVPRIEFDDE